MVKTDLKSPDRKIVPVRVRLRAPPHCAASSGSLAILPVTGIPDPRGSGSVNRATVAHLLAPQPELSGFDLVNPIFVQIGFRLVDRFEVEPPLEHFAAAAS